MQEPCEKGVANHSAPSFAAGAVKPPLKRKQGNRWAGYRASKSCNRDADAVIKAEGDADRGANASPWPVPRSRRCRTVVLANADATDNVRIVSLSSIAVRALAGGPDCRVVRLVSEMREAFPWESAPRYLLRDRDRIFGKDFVDQVKAMGIKQVLSAPRSTWQRAYIERVIGTLRRECLDHMIVLNERCLCGHLKSFAEYYHRSRTHLALEKDSPEPRPIQAPNSATNVTRTIEQHKGLSRSRRKSSEGFGV